MISIVCAYNKPEVFTKYLLASLDVQDAEYELIPVDNRDGTYKSAAQALNYGGRKATGDYVMFVHQDISLTSRNFLKEAEWLLEQVRDLGAAGLAGKRSRQKVLTHLTHGEPARLAGNPGFAGTIDVQTLDECLIVVPRSVFDRLQFDERVCDGWHLYAVDYALSAKELGLRIVVLPLAGHHGSSGHSMNNDYYRTLRNVLVKHRTSYRLIFTSMGDWNTRTPVLLQQYRNEFKRRKSRALEMLSRLLRNLM